MASVSPHKWRNGRACRQETGRPPHGQDCTCKVQSWRVFWRNPDGSKRSEVHTLKRDADARKAEFESSQNRGTYVDPMRGRQQFREYAAEWAAAQDWKASTRKGWSQIMKRLEPHLGDLRLNEVDKLTLERTRADLAKTYGRGVVEGTMFRAKAIMRHAVANGDIGRDPTIGVKAAPKRRADDTSGKVGPDDIPTRAEALRILTAAPTGYRAAIALGLAGLRIGEVLGMTADRIKLDTRHVTVNQQTDGYTITTPKAEKIRTLVVPQLVAMELRRHLRVQPSGWLFPGGGKDGQLHRERFYELGWTPALRDAGLVDERPDGKQVGRFVFHSLRHFCASTLLAEGAPLTAVAAHLGDTVETVSRTYVHWLRDEADVPAEVLDRVLAPAEADASPMPHAKGI